MKRTGNTGQSAADNRRDAAHTLSSSPVSPGIPAAHGGTNASVAPAVVAVLALSAFMLAVIFIVLWGVAAVSFGGKDALPFGMVNAFGISVLLVAVAELLSRSARQSRQARHTRNNSNGAHPVHDNSHSANGDSPVHTMDAVHQVHGNSHSANGDSISNARYSAPMCRSAAGFSVPIAVVLGLLVAATTIISQIAMHPSARLLHYGGWVWIGIPIIAILVMHLVGTLSYKIHLQSHRQVFDIVLRFMRVVGVLFFAISVTLPFYFMIVASLKPRAFLLQNPTNLNIPFSQGIGNLFTGYIEVMRRFNFGRYILNSTVVSLCTVVITLIPAILGAYAVTRLNFKGRRWLSSSILLIYMFPAIVLAIPLYSIFTQLGVRNSLVGLLLVYPAMTIPVALYMLRSYFHSLPRDIEEAGMIDGCTRARVILKITLPLSMPALASVALYVFMIAWNEFLFAFMFLDAPDIFTLSRGVVSLNTQEVPRQFLMAGSVIITVPIMVLFFYFEKFLVGGLSAGGVKG